MSYYKICPHCGAHLDPGEVCDCIPSLYACLSPKDRAAVDAKITELRNKAKAPASAANAGEGRGEQSLTDADSTSMIPHYQGGTQDGKF